MWQGWVVPGLYVGLLVALCVLVPADSYEFRGTCFDSRPPLSVA